MFSMFSCFPSVENRKTWKTWKTEATRLRLPPLSLCTGEYTVLFLGVLLGVLFEEFFLYVGRYELI